MFKKDIIYEQIITEVITLMLKITVKKHTKWSTLSCFHDLKKGIYFFELDAKISIILLFINNTLSVFI